MIELTATEAVEDSSEEARDEEAPVTEVLANDTNEEEGDLTVSTETPEPVETVETTPESDVPDGVELTTTTQPMEDTVHSENGPVAGIEERAVEVVDPDNVGGPDNEVAATSNNLEAVNIDTAPQVVPAISSYDEMINTIMNGTDRGLQAIVGNVNRYYAMMKPRTPVMPRVGAAAQTELWRAILVTINNPNYNEFKKQWTLWLAIFNNYNNSIFSLPYAFRFFEFISIPKNQVVAFQSILNLLILTANPATRANNLRRVDLEKSLSVYFNEANRQQIIAFYS